MAPTVEEVAAFAEEVIYARQGQFLSDLEVIEVNGKPALTRTYRYGGRKYKEVYIAEGNRGYFLRFTAASRFYESSLKDFEHTVASFQVINP